MRHEAEVLEGVALKRGGQKGHKKHDRPAFPPEAIDQTVVYELRAPDAAGLIALEEWHKRFPHYEVLEDKLEWVHSSNVRGFSSLPVRIIR